MRRKNVVIMGAAGRDFHNFNVVFRNDPSYRVIAFTAAQIPNISGRLYPSSLAGRLYPRGIAIIPESELPGLMLSRRVDVVVFSYSDVSHQEVMHRASMALAAGAEFRLLGPDETMLESRKPVISVCAVRTGCGKSQLTRYICALVRGAGLKPVVVRHPMPYGELEQQVVERFAHMDDLTLYRCTIEEREEYEPLIRSGGVVFSGVDYRRVLRAAEREGEIIIWDGGNNDFPFFRPDLEIVIADPLRPGDETSFYPGEVNLRRADLVVINKINAAEPRVVASLAQSIAVVNPGAMVVRTRSRIELAEPESIAGKRVLVVEDGPTITHGGMPSGAGLAAAQEFGAAEVVDPRPYGVGSIAGVFRRYPHIGPVLPAMGYGHDQVNDLRLTMEATPCDLILSATPIDLGRVISLAKPILHVSYEIEEEEGAHLRELVNAFLALCRDVEHPGEKTLQKMKKSQ